MEVGQFQTAAAPRRDSGRGVAYWSNGTDQRIFTVTPGFQLVALDARTGRPVTGFGKDGVVDLKAQLGVPIDLKTAAIGSSSGHATTVIQKRSGPDPGD